MQKDLFLNRHIGPNPEAEQHMLNGLGISSTEQLIDETVPESIRLSQPLNVPAAISEQEYAKHIQDLADKNKLLEALLGKDTTPLTRLQLFSEMFLKIQGGIPSIHLIKLR